jgi:uncharacterized protein YkwD
MRYARSNASITAIAISFVGYLMFACAPLRSVLPIPEREPSVVDSVRVSVPPSSTPAIPNLPRAVFDEVNLARTDPAAYAGYIPVVDEASREAVEYLRSVDPISALDWHDGLVHSAIEHIDDTGRIGVLSHTGTDGSSPQSRMERHIEPDEMSATGENIQYGVLSPRGIVVELIVDREVLDRGHRHNIYSPLWTHMGTAIGPHADYQMMCVMDFARFGPPLMPVFDMDPAEASHDIVREINLARSNPTEYARFLADMDFDPADLMETVAFLDTVVPKTPLRPNPGLMQMASAYATDIAASEGLDHPLTLRFRADQHMQDENVLLLRELVNAGAQSPRDAVAQFIVNANDPAKSYRKALFGDEFGSIGAALGPHQGYGIVCVVEVAEIR